MCSTDVGCPVLSATWGVVVATDPSTNQTQTFRDVMAGPGWVKEWNWGHHADHVTHAGGIPPGEIDEVMEEMEHQGGGTSLDTFFISTGMNGELHNNPAAVARVKELWNVDAAVSTSAALTAEYNNALSFVQMEHASAVRALAERYNAAVRDGQRAAIILHSTC